MWDLSFVSRHLDEWRQVAGLVVWKGLELQLAWLLNFDGDNLWSFRGFMVSRNWPICCCRIIDGRTGEDAAILFYLLTYTCPDFLFAPLSWPHVNHPGRKCPRFWSKTRKTFERRMKDPSLLKIFKSRTLEGEKDAFWYTSESQDEYFSEYLYPQELQK